MCDNGGFPLNFMKYNIGVALSLLDAVVQTYIIHIMFLTDSITIDLPM